MKIDLYTFCYNEERIIPFAIDYWKYMHINHIFVYDNGSTDKSKEILGKYPDWITIVPFDTNNEINELKYLDVKNNCWKDSDADYVIVCDMDEVLYCENWDNEIQWMLDNNKTIIKPLGVQVVFENFPEYNQGVLLNQKSEARFFNDHRWFSKSIMFNPKKIQEIDFDPGCHTCHPKGTVNFAENRMYLFHLKNLSEEYVVSKFQSSRQRLSAINKKNRWAYQYEWEDEKVRKMYRENLFKSNHNLTIL